MPEQKLISTKEELKTHIHGIHNYMRNNGVGYGFDALNTFNLIYGLKLLEDLIKSGKLDDVLSKDEKKALLFSKLAKMAEKADDDELYHKIDGEICDILSKHKELKEIFFYEIPKDLRSEVIRNIVLKINAIDTKNNHHLAGKVYEYFIGRDETAISSLGAYFTDRWISKFIIDVLIKNKKITVSKKGLIKSFCDPFGGSGGFTLTYIQELIKFAEENKIEINWDDEIKKLSHCDISNNVIRMVKLEIFTLTHSFADENKVKKTNSFTNEFTDKYDLILSNPPYGGDKKEEKILIQKCSNLIKNYAQKELDISKIKTDAKSGVVKNYPLGGDNKENAGCLLFLSMLADKGVCVAVLKEGLFFDSKFEKLRKEMIENYNVFKVVDIPADAFENTTTKTSILFLEKTGKTDKIVFSKLCADKKSDGEIIGVHEEFVDTRSKKEVDENKEINGMVAYKQIVDKKYSLSYKKYAYVKEECSDEFKMVRLGDICEIKYGTRITKSKDEIKEDYMGNKYPVYGGGDITFYTNKYNREEKTLIISRFGISKECVRLIYGKIFLNDSSLSLISKGSVHIDYISHILIKMQDKIYELTNQSCQKNLDIEQFLNLKIPIPKSNDKMLEWVEKIDLQYDIMTNGKQLLKTFEKEVQYDIKDMCRKNECDEYKLGDICNIKSGNHSIKKCDFKQGEYPIIGGGINPIGKHNEYNCDENTILCTSHGSVGHITMYPIKTFLTMCFGIIPKNNIEKIYLYYYLKMNNKYIIELGNGTAQKVITKSDLSDRKSV